MKKRFSSLLLALVLVLSFASCSGEAEETTEKPTESDEAPAHTHTEEEITPDAAPDFTVYNKEGKSVKLSDMKGTPVVLNFWASWCPPCKAEMPDFDEIAKEYSGKVVFMMVNQWDTHFPFISTRTATRLINTEFNQFRRHFLLMKKEIL